MLKNITLSAEEALIEQSRERARREKTTLNEVFRRWLSSYAGQHKAAEEFAQMMEQLSYARAGRSFTRDEMNER